MLQNEHNSIIVKSPLYLTENLSGGQLPHVLWGWPVGLLSIKNLKKEEDPQRCYVGLTVIHGIFSTFIPNVENNLWNIVSPTEHYEGSEYSYERRLWH